MSNDRSRRYRSAISLGLRPEQTTDGDREFLALFERAVEELHAIAADIALTQKGIVYSDAGSIKNLRPRRFEAGRLIDYMNSAGAAQESVYVFDALTATNVPRFLAHGHWFRKGRIGNITLRHVEAPVGRFALLALDSSLLDTVAESQFDEIARRLHEQIGGVKGGVLVDRPYVWNGKAGLEWAYREIPQMISSGDVAAWAPPFDRVF